MQLYVNCRMLFKSDNLLNQYCPPKCDLSHKKKRTQKTPHLNELKQEGFTL